jgi:predicted Rossmann fold flavoprotein
MITPTGGAEFDFIILGAGAAGMMAAIACGEQTLAAGRPVPRIAVLEKNRHAGIKVLVCGGGRCNLTNAGDCDFLIGQFGRNGRFLAPALRYFDNTALCHWFAAHGVPTHEEHDGKIYPDSNQARSVVDAMVRRMAELGVEVRAGQAALEVAFNPDDKLFAITTAVQEKLLAKFLLIAVGGQSYTRMGTTGDGYRFASVLGHSVVTPRPAIVPLLCREPWITELQGVAVPDVQVRIEVSGPLPRLATGKPAPSVNDLLFTHFGLSGPAVLNLSEIVAELLERFSEVPLRIDFVRRFSQDQLAELMRRWHADAGRKLVKTVLSELVPQRLAEMFCRLSGIAPEQTCANLTGAQMHALLTHLKASRFRVYQTRGFKEAMVTAGGVRLDEVDPNTMQSRRNNQLYLAGEVLDLTGPSGGYNLQLAFSTGSLAGTSVAKRLMAATSE